MFMTITILNAELTEAGKEIAETGGNKGGKMRVRMSYCQVFCFFFFAEGNRTLFRIRR